MKREKKPYSKKKSITILVVGVFGIALAFTLLCVGAKLQGDGVNQSIYLPLCLSFFPICIGDVAFLIYHYPGIALHDMQEQLEKKNEFAILDHIDFDILACFQENQFQWLEEGYLYKKKFSLNKDFIHYYVKKCLSTDVQETINQEFDRFDSCKFQSMSANRCFILIIEKDEITKEDLNIVSKTKNIFVSMEVVPQMVNHTSIVALLDKSTQCLYLVKPGTNKLSMYYAGYKQIKKLLNQKVKKDSSAVS